jgi:hypothetical protein
MGEKPMNFGTAYLRENIQIAQFSIPKVDGAAINRAWVADIGRILDIPHFCLG